MQFKKNLVLFLTLFAVVSSLQAQNPAPIGTWTPYVSHRYPEDVVIRDGKINVITQGGYYIYDDEAEEIATYTVTDGLSGTNPTAIFYDEASDQIFLGFGNGMINFFNDIDKKINYITDIERSALFTTKTVNQITSNDGNLFIATSFGIVIYNIEARETRNTVTKVGLLTTGSSVNSILLQNDTIWAAMGIGGLWYASASHPNLSDPSAWNLESGFRDLPLGTVNLLSSAGGNVYSIVDTVIFRKEDTNWVPSPFSVGTYSYFNAADDILVAARGSDAEVLYPGDSLRVIDIFAGITCALPQGDLVWLGDDANGMRKVTEFDFIEINPPGPKNNFIKEIIAGDGEFYIAPSPRSGTGSSFDKSGIYYFSRETDWKIIARSEGNIGNEVWYGFTCAYYDPGTETAYLGSTSLGIMELRHGDTIQTWTHHNSGIVGGSSETDLRVTSMAKDSRGNLWVVTVFADANRVLNVKGPDDTWYNYALPSGTHPSEIIVDAYDNKWILDQGGGVLVFNENGTLDITSDDNLRSLSSSPGSGALLSNNVSSIIKDLEGQIWIGTVDGVSVFFDPFDIFGGGFIDASCPVFENQCLMKSLRVNAMAVDGANRKWIGTDNGVFLISEDGTEQVYHFTTENSDLLSNKILTIAVDPGTGEVFFGTEAGLISFMGDAVEGEATSEEVYVFPNPVFSDYQGNVTIRGTVAEASVKITTVDGRLVKEIESLGGQAVWDRTDEWGNRAKSGVYLALISDKDGKKRRSYKICIDQQMMKLIFLSHSNLRDRNFVTDLVHHFKTQEKVLLLHDHYGNVSDTRFVSKRLSALLSEAMVVNNVLSGDQRNIITVENEEISIRGDFLSGLLETVQLIILNPIAKSGDKIFLPNPEKVLRAIRETLSTEETIFFPDNTLSPMTQSKSTIESKEEYDRLIGVYEEEKPTLDRALAFAPAAIASPSNFLK